MNITVRHVFRLTFFLLFLITLDGSVVAQTEKNAAKNLDSNQKSVSPKRTGAKRIGILLPSVTLSNAGDRVDPADAVRNTFITLLNSDGIELIALDSRLSALAIKEATDRDCDYVLKISLVQRRGDQNGFLNRILDKSADSAITQTTARIPSGRSVPSSVGREAVVGASQEVTQIQFTIRKKDELILDYQLSTPKSKSVVESKLTKKAERDNDAVLMPLIETAADEIARFVLSPKG